MDENRCVGVADMLRARDERAARQADALARYGCTLISFTMNIAGETKKNTLIRRAFEEGVSRIKRQLERMNCKVRWQEMHTPFTGCEALWAVEADAQQLKQAMCLLEEADSLGRLFDMDVISADGAHLSRGQERSCLICGGPVRACARSRAHSAQELYQKAMQIISGFLEDRFACYVGEMAEKALLYEAITTPKPGLVDCANNGAHQDMDLFSFVNSACALRNYFEKCVHLGLCNAPLQQLQHAGQQAEDAMQAAARANTHKGAIFALGILCYAAGQCSEGAARQTVLDRAAQTGSWFLKQMQHSCPGKTGGEQQYHRYGLTGARGEAASGYQTVQKIALPALEQALSDGKTLEQAGLHALLALMACMKDSNIIRRAGLEGQVWASEQAQRLLKEGWTPNDLRALDEQFIRRNISPGGSADLLAVTYFLHFLAVPEQRS